VTYGFDISMDHVLSMYVYQSKCGIMKLIDVSYLSQ
jgi:hypothetical protein